jgi:hypothetical protein
MIHMPPLSSALPPVVPISWLCHPSGSTAEALTARPSTTTKEVKRNNFLHIIVLL